IWRARWLASSTSSKRLGILSTQSSTVTRAIGQTPAKNREIRKGRDVGADGTGVKKKPAMPGDALIGEQRMLCVGARMTPLPVLHIDAHMIVIDKPAGLAVHAGPKAPYSLENRLAEL